MQWYCKAQLFTSQQAQRSQRHNMSQHAKQCKLEHPRFPETERHGESRGGKKIFPFWPEQNCDSLPVPHTQLVPIRDPLPSFLGWMAQVGSCTCCSKGALRAKHIASYGYEPRGTTVRVCQQLRGRKGQLNQFCSAFCFPQKTEEEEAKRTSTRSSTAKEARAVWRNVSVMRANYDQYSTLTSNPHFPWCYFRCW